MTITKNAEKKEKVVAVIAALNLCKNFIFLILLIFIPEIAFLNKVL